MKAMIKFLVTSAAYRQNSAVTPELVERDPENRLLARGPRFRLRGELVRDQGSARIDSPGAAAHDDLGAKEFPRRSEPFQIRPTR